MGREEAATLSKGQKLLDDMMQRALETAAAAATAAVGILPSLYCRVLMPSCRLTALGSPWS